MKQITLFMAIIAVLLMSCGNGKNYKYTADLEISSANADSVMLNSEPKAMNDYASDNEVYDTIIENNFLSTSLQPLSTFSIDVDEAAYANVRRYLQAGNLPPKGAVRIEEMVNYFQYDYPQPQNDVPFSINTELASCPWNNQHQLMHVGLQGKQIELDRLPPSNLVFLIDVSGSMEEPNKLPLVKASLKLLISQLRDDDKVAIVVYASNTGLVLPSTKGTNKAKIKAAIDNLNAGGSTAGGEGIQLAYKVAKDNFKRNGNNRIILCTDGDFNVGISSDEALETLIEDERKTGIYLTVLGYGMGNYKDNKMQKLADKGNGNHAYIDNLNEAKKVLVNEFGSTLFTIAKDVKLQLEFNPQFVQSYRLIGYENRMLAAQDFSNDKKDAGELGAGHTVTALYEIIPVGVKDSFTNKVDQLKYQQLATANNSNELLTIKLRYKLPKNNDSQLITHVVDNVSKQLENASDNFKFSAAVAEFGMLLRASDFKQSASYKQVIQLAKASKGLDENGYKSEFLQLVETAALLSTN